MFRYIVYFLLFVGFSSVSLGGDKHYRGIVSYLIDVAKGNIPGEAIVNKFGTKPVITTSTDPATVWPGTGLYEFTPDTALSMEAVSTSAEDRGALRATGTATGGTKSTVIDITVNFVDSGVVVGDLFVNDDNDEYSIITGVDSTELDLLEMTNGSQAGRQRTANTAGDAYRVIYADSTGAGAVVTYGLDSNYLCQNEITVLNGTTEVNFTKKYIRQWRSAVLVGASRSGAVGVISIRDTSDADTACLIHNGYNQTQQAFFTIPANMRGFFLKGYVAVGKGAGATATSALFTWRVTPFGGVKNVSGEIEIVNTGAGHWQYEYKGAPSLPPRADVEVICEEVSGTVGVEAGMDILLSDL